MRAQLSVNSLPPGVVVVLGVLDVIAIVDLVRRPRARVTFDNKWVWVAILVNFIGAILYLVVGRKPALHAGASPALQERHVTSPTSVADELYGPADRSDDR
ncbi:PLD nuclease N-terminal domain-containing protein [Leifsonia poae]|uniref:PLD nuclease N-terminal domain-containing protein n=1 Tax=Leifsonia poae TaxID=110933 RepID=UPI003D670DB8